MRMGLGISHAAAQSQLAARAAAKKKLAELAKAEAVEVEAVQVEPALAPVLLPVPVEAPAKRGLFAPVIALWCWAAGYLAGRRRQRK